MAAAALIGAGYVYLVYTDRCEPLTRTEIFQGITYGCKQLDATEQGSGLVKWVIVNLGAPGIELYVTPLDTGAVARGWQYRLRRIGDVVAKERLAVAINGTLFTSNSNRWLRMAGDLAKSVETVVADHGVSHVWEHTYLLWFDNQLTPNLRRSKPPSADELAQAQWGIGGQAVELLDGVVWPWSGRIPAARTAVAIDRQRKLLFLAVGQQVSPSRLLEELAKLGAKDGMLLDGGGSSSMAIGRGASGIRAGIVLGGWRPVATFFGIRANPVLRAH
jgi:hypothetical protein